MISGLKSIKRRVKERLGPLWWYAAVMFGVQRLGDLINIYIGLWLVPHWIPASQLGALLPLGQIGALLSLPLAVVLTPFLKFVNVFAARGEMGKVKALIQDVLAIVAVSSVGVAIYTYLVCPLVFDRLRVGGGGLGWLLCGLAITSALAPVLANALQSLRNFRVIAASGLIPPPIRLAALWLLLPTLGLVGFFSVQLLVVVVSIGIAAWGLRNVLSPSIKRESYHGHLREIGRFTLPILILTMASSIRSTCETVVIRHALPDMESAAYYLVSRFAEIPNSFWGAISMVFFPLISERHEQGIGSNRLLRHAMMFTLAAGGVMGVALTWGADWLLGLQASWRVYRSYDWLMGVLVIRTVLFQAATCFFTYEMACRRFRFVPFIVVLECGSAGLLYGLTHVGFFRPYLPPSWRNALSSIQACRLDFVVTFMLVVSCLYFLVAMLDMLVPKKNDPVRPNITG